jgi:hypothetical protein
MLLERAVGSGDFQQAMAAQQQLLRLGVHVRYGRPSRVRSTPGGAA